MKKPIETMTRILKETDPFISAKVSAKWLCDNENREGGRKKLSGMIWHGGFSF